MADNADYIAGYIKGVEDLAKKLIGYYNVLPGSTPALLAAYHVEVIKSEMLSRLEEDTNEPV